MSVRPHTAIVFQLVAVDVGSRLNELVEALKTYACSEHAADILLTRAGHVLLWRANETDRSKIHPRFVDDTKRLARLLKLTSEPIHLTGFDDRPDLFLAYWFGGASVNTADGTADVADRFQNCDTDDDGDGDFVDHDLSLWFRVGDRLVDDDAILEQRRLANAPTTSAAKETLIWKTPTTDVVRPIATPPTRRYQVPCAAGGKLVLITVPDDTTLYVERLEHLIFLTVTKK